jgi:hypothetical protein
MITKNKIIELPCFVGDTVYYIQYPTNAASWCEEKPVIVEMKVSKISYEAVSPKGETYEKIRVDTSYKNKLGDDAFTFFIWSHGELYISKQDAEKHLDGNGRCSLLAQ